MIKEARGHNLRKQIEVIPTMLFVGDPNIDALGESSRSYDFYVRYSKSPSSGINMKDFIPT